jgi:hypothetical protein
LLQRECGTNRQPQFTSITAGSAAIRSSNVNSASGDYNPVNCFGSNFIALISFDPPRHRINFGSWIIHLVF